MLEYKDEKSSVKTTFVHITNWQSILRKSVRTKDDQPIGSVARVSGDDNILVASQSGRQLYEIPKIYVEQFNGAEVSLKLYIVHIDRFKI